VFGLSDAAFAPVTSAPVIFFTKRGGGGEHSGGVLRVEEMCVTIACACANADARAHAHRPARGRGLVAEEHARAWVGADRSVVIFCWPRECLCLVGLCMCCDVFVGGWVGGRVCAWGRAAAEGFSSTSPRAHWIGPE